MATNKDDELYSTASGYTFRSKPVNTFDEAKPVYENRYDERINNLADTIANRQAFSYDAESDPTYQQYKKDYTRYGQRAMQDTLGQVAARTGGIASSYATSAATQAYNNYMNELASKIPELEQIAYGRYNDNLNNQRADLSMYQGLEQTDYGKYADLLAQWNADRAWAGSQYETELNQWNTDKSFDYGTAEEKAAQLAAYGDFDGYRLLGYTEAEIALMKAAWDAAQVPKSSGGTKYVYLNEPDDDDDDYVSEYTNETHGHDDEIKVGGNWYDKDTAGLLVSNGTFYAVDRSYTDSNGDTVKKSEVKVNPKITKTQGWDVLQNSLKL